MKNQKENNPTGRPTKYKKEFAEQAYRLCLLGATDAQLGEFFDVSELTVNRWKKDYPEFCKSIKRGKLDADAKVAESLFKRACGYQYTEVKKRECPVYDEVTGEDTGVVRVVEVTTTTKEVPPDTGAAFIWLKNRRSQNWRDKHEVTVKHKIDKEMMDRISTEMVERLAKARERQKQVLIERGIAE